jgi:tRNA threonylcarbamoyl adenosine modification protein YeaZ
MPAPSIDSAQPAADPLPPGERSVGPGLLALHSSGAVLAVGWRSLADAAADRIAVFDPGRALANQLLSCVEMVCPAAAWPRLQRLAVAVGPGGFTSTRITVVFARTLAQQLQLPLDGVGSQQLVARRLDLPGPSWLVQELPRRGLVAGLYGPDPEEPGGVREILAPRLYADAEALTACDPAPQLPLPQDPAADVAALLDLAQMAQRAGRSAPWQRVLPIYASSPVAGA